MRSELTSIVGSIETRELPENPNELFSSFWNNTDQCFGAQETYVLDYKEDTPKQFSSGYGAAIIRLVLAFHNSFGGIIVFGVSDSTRKVLGAERLDQETLSDLITGITKTRIELVYKEYRFPSSGLKVQVLLVPRREYDPPVTLIANFDKYPSGTIWIRDRHSVREAGENFYPILYSARSDFTEDEGSTSRSVHQSLPPSPATMQRFIGRKSLLGQLWQWLVFDAKPRLYLHGPGGSGKSTLAYEFSSQVADRGSSITYSDGTCLDYVVFISGKETELNPHVGAEQPFNMRSFSDRESQFRAILVDSGFKTKQEAEGLSSEDLDAELSDLFNTYSGLIVVDDVDALSRRNKDTGEEGLFYLIMKASKRTRVLYTLRYPPPSALNSSVKVPELEENAEFPEFVEACALQLNMPPPDGREYRAIGDATSRLPLLIETVIGLRGPCGSYGSALDQFRDKGGDDARSYLYQREFDRLDPRGRSREVLASLMLLDEEVSFPVLKRILGFNDSHVRDAISECGSIFLVSRESEKGETLYKLAPPAKGFIANVTAELNYFGTLKRRVELFLKEDASFTPEESALIVQMDQLIRAKAYQDAADLFESQGKNPVTANQRVQALAGQAYANLGPDARTKARECFKAADELGYMDIFMARSWFHVENMAEYGNRNAIVVCDRVLASSKMTTRYRAEFKNKLGNCYYDLARRMRNISSEKAIDAYKMSVENYLSSLWIGRNVHQLDEEKTLSWMWRPTAEFVDFIGDDLEPYFAMIGGLVSQKHDIHPEGANVLMHALGRTRADRDKQLKSRLLGLIRRTNRRIESFIGDGDFPGFEFIIRTLTVVQARLGERGS